MLNEILVVFHNRSNYDYHFIITELPNKFEGRFQITEKHKTFSVPVEKEVTKINKYGNESAVTICFKI